MVNFSLGKTKSVSTAGRGMKRLPIIVFAGILAIILAGSCCIIGCGNKNDQQSNDDVSENGTTEVVDLTEDVSTGIIGIFMKGEDKIEFTKDGKFAITGPAGSKEGTYNISESADGTSKATLTYTEGSEEDWSVMIGDGKVAAVVNPDGDQWTKP